ncbi:hypothetical protein AUC61_01450 [Pseudomonas sp. S25]|uniref:Uncharacterized protein n=1 Tax=Pseudomonas maioricensis TaxID=1766623 RepID=A0ABS9ZF50_9PSED|nr:hypothetical protein [Pseudomonas sp. S25]MCI8208187.1 hypothetical protein [Pseudomonas sp. S25]
MHGSELKNGEHSTLEEDPRPKLWPKVLGSLAIVGLMIGLMIGRLTEPAPLELLQIEERPTGLALWFNRDPKVLPEHVDGTFALRFTAKGQPWRGQLKINGKDVRWRLERDKRDLLLTLLAARPLHGDLHGEKLDGRWRLEVSLREE